MGSSPKEVGTAEVSPIFPDLLISKINFLPAIYPSNYHSSVFILSTDLFHPQVSLILSSLVLLKHCPHQTISQSASFHVQTIHEHEASLIQPTLNSLPLLLYHTKNFIHIFITFCIPSSTHLMNQVYTLITIYLYRLEITYPKFLGQML